MTGSRFVNRLFAFAAAISVVVFVVTSPSPATPPETQPAPESQMPGDPGEMSAFQQEMMQKMGQYATTGEQHALLAKKVGQWDHHVKMWCDPDPNAPPMETSGSTETKMILGGRFLVDHTTGEFNGQKFEGMGISGYDNIKQKYISMWIDTMGTGMMTAEGEADAKGKVLTYTCQYSCPMVGGPKTSKTVETMIDDNTWKMEMFDTGPDGEEKKTFEILYTRKQ